MNRIPAVVMAAALSACQEVELNSREYVSDVASQSGAFDAELDERECRNDIESNLALCPKVTDPRERSWYLKSRIVSDPYNAGRMCLRREMDKCMAARGWTAVEKPDAMILWCLFDCWGGMR